MRLSRPSAPLKKNEATNIDGHSVDHGPNVTNDEASIGLVILFGGLKGSVLFSNTMIAVPLARSFQDQGYGREAVS